MADPLTAILQATGAANDDALISAGRDLAQKAVARADYILDHGSPQQQIAVIRAVAPAIGRGIGTQSEDEEMNTLRAALSELQEVVLGVKSA